MNKTLLTTVLVLGTAITGLSVTTADAARHTTGGTAQVTAPAPAFALPDTTEGQTAGAPEVSPERLAHDMRRKGHGERRHRYDHGHKKHHKHHKSHDRAYGHSEYHRRDEYHGHRHDGDAWGHRRDHNRYEDRDRRHDGHRDGYRHRDHGYGDRDRERRAERERGAVIIDVNPLPDLVRRLDGATCVLGGDPLSQACRDWRDRERR